MGKPNGWLVVNRFLNTSKFTELTGLLCGAAAQHGIGLDVYTNDELLPAICGGGGRLPDEAPDFVLFYDKDVILARALEARGMRLLNSARAIELCDDKALTHLALSGFVPMPRTVSAPFTYENVGYTDRAFVRDMFGILGSPLVIKEAFGSFGKQVYLAETPEDADRILDGVCGRRVIFQEFIRESAGRDLRLNVVGGRVVAAMERTNPNGDFRANISNGGVMRPHTPTFEETRLALRTAEVLGLDFCGVDLLLSNDGPVVCEVNSNAHFKSIFECTGVNAADEIMRYILRGADGC
ncbi:MAG: RimK family alpha-L-glutamate ligase [Clostridia bacterium]|nr:RimK family alpha-L-glutamate ligase [Clostridia bacterium]